MSSFWQGRESLIFRMGSRKDAHRHNFGIYWRPRKSCQYPGHEGKKIALHCKNPINWQMAQEIREMFVTLVQVGSRK